MKKDYSNTSPKQNRALKSLLVIGLLVFSLGSCVKPVIDPLSLDILEIDKQEATYPPTADELAITPRLLLPLLVYKDETVTDSRLENILEFTHSSFEKYGNFAAISQSKVDELMKLEENKLFQASNVADAIQLGKNLNASFVSQIQVMIAESEMVKGVDHYTANVNLTIFTTDSGQVVFKKDVILDTLDREKSDRDLKKLVQEYFPKRGFILETRGGRQFAKISLGRSMGIGLERELQVRDRTVKNEIVLGISRRTVTFDSIALATVSVIKVMEDESWVEIDTDDRSKVKKGLVVFTLPEKGNIYQ